MALATREIPREEWGSYFDRFSRELGDRVATVEIVGADIGAQVEAEHPRLTGITYDRGDDVVVIGLDAPGGLPEDLERIIDHPQKIYVAEGEDETMVFDVEDAEGTQTLLRLQRAS